MIIDDDNVMPDDVKKLYDEAMNGNAEAQSNLDRLSKKWRGRRKN